jgi:hypothetical protein
VRSADLTSCSDSVLVADEDYIVVTYNGSKLDADPRLLIQENKKLGRTLASGSSTRLSQGVLMPLFPTVNMNLKYRSGTITDSASDVRSAHGHCP